MMLVFLGLTLGFVISFKSNCKSKKFCSSLFLLTLNTFLGLEHRRHSCSKSMMETPKQCVKSVQS